MMDAPNFLNEKSRLVGILGDLIMKAIDFTGDFTGEFIDNW
jgi:hypothetical protein